MAGRPVIARVKKVRRLIESLGNEVDFRKLHSILNALEVQVNDGHYRRYAVTRLCEALLATAESYDIPEERARQLENAACAVVALVEGGR